MTSKRNVHTVTGAFGYTGNYIAKALLAHGETVETLSSQSPNDAFAKQITRHPFNFDEPDKLCKSLHNTKVIYNTYWVRFSYGTENFESAVTNTRILLDCAKQAGVERFVHVSVSNPSLDSKLPYFRNKAILEEAVKDSGISYAIVRPTIIFGEGDILINNIAWLLRRFPFMAVPGFGKYKLQPVSADDLAELTVKVGAQSANLTIDAAGPNICSFKEMLQLIAKSVGSRALIIPMPPLVALLLSKILSVFLGDIMLTKDEMDGLMQNLLISKDPATCSTRLEEWMQNNANKLGSSYSSEIKRHFTIKPT